MFRLINSRCLVMLAADGFGWGGTTPPRTHTPAGDGFGWGGGAPPR